MSARGLAGAEAGVSLLRLVRTLVWLQPRQIGGQLAWRARRLLERPDAWLRRRVPPDPGLRWSPRGEFLPPGAQRLRAEVLRAGRFEFLNRCESLGWPPRWDAQGLPHLWAYNLHYFEYLFALSYLDARSLVLDWIARHPLGRGQVGWEPYPTSLRLESWCTCFFGRHRARSQADPELRAALWSSMQLQADWLAAHLEVRLLGNHLFENAAALTLCGACFAGPQADAWLARGLAVLARELEEQVLPDGGHFERSPMYQARIAWVLDTLEKTGCASVVRLVQAPLARLRAALAALCHPDGEIALLNDSAFGIANRPAELAPPAPPGPFALPETGYYGARGAEGHYVVCDAAPIGPDYLPGHAHGDIFSFELSLSGRRVIVDAGVYGYEADESRAACRSTRAHNTVEIDGEDQCEFWAAFRVARRGRPRDVTWQARDGGFALEGWHDGYERLPSRARHRRRFRWYPEGVLLVRDEVTARRALRGCSRLHLHPACEVRLDGPAQARVVYPGGSFRIAFAGKGELAVESFAYHPEFGVAQPSRALAFQARGPATTGFCVAAGDAPLCFDLDAGARVGETRYPA